MPGILNLKSTIQNYRREMKDGKEFLVVPGVPVQEQVMNNYLVPADEIAHFAAAWNGSPITLRHPKQNNGSANVPIPDVPIIGRFYNAEFDGKRLTGEYWFEDQALQAQAPIIRNRILAGDAIETSTGYWADEEAIPGTFDNRSYELIHRNLRPDHIAVLPDEIGACSMSDGCGVNRNCADANCPMGDQCPMKKPMKGKTAMTMNELLAKLGVKAKVKVNAEEGQEPSFELEQEPTPAPVQAPAAQTPAPIFSETEIAALRALAASASVLQNAALFAQNAANEAQTRKNGLIAQIKTNAANPFNDVQLQAMDEDALLKFNAHLNTSFAGLGGVNQNADEALIAIPPDTFNWSTSTSTSGGK